ncbi:uncharacterized protein LOC134062502 [Sardina pilchardus]|uniref:uncharacterized protein LOC134062502 n=1 Tax=Sardina pilchardus TaxID=27697 RepID=UPI002E12B544
MHTSVVGQSYDCVNMHPQSYQVTQQNQVLYSYPVNSNQYGQPVGNAWLHSNQTNQIQSSQGIPSSNFNQQVHCRPSHHHLSSQHGTYPPQTSYNGNGSHIMSSPNRDSVCPTAVSASALTSGTYNSSRGYSTVDTDTLNYLLSNNPNVNRSSHSGQTLQLQTGQLHQSSSQVVHVNTQNVENVSSHQSQALQLQKSHCQPGISNQGRYGQHIQNISNCAGKIFLKNQWTKQKLAQAYPPNSDNSKLQNTQTNGRSGSIGPALQPTQNSLIPCRAYGQNVTPVPLPASRRNVVGQSPTTSSTMASQFTIHTNTSTHSPPVSSNEQRLNLLYHYGPHSQSALSQNMNVPSCSNALPPSATNNNSLPPPNNGTMFRYSAAHINQNNPTPVGNSPMVASPSPLSDVNGLPPPPYPGTYSQSAPSKNVSVSSSGSSDFLPSTARANCSLPPRCHVLGSPSSVHTSQNNHTFVDSSNRNKSSAPNLGNGHSVHGALAQQENASVDSPQWRLFQQQHSQRKADLYNNHTTNSRNKPSANPLLYLLITGSQKDTQNIEQNIAFMDCNGSITQGSPNKSVQTHRAVAVVPPISKPPGIGSKGKKCDDVLPSNYDDHQPLLIKDLPSLADDIKTKEANVLPCDTGSAAMRKTSSCVKSSEVGCRPEADVTDETVVCNNLDSLNSLPPENKDTPKDQNNEELCGPDVFFGVPVVPFSLTMLKALAIALELVEEEKNRRKNENRINNKPECADAVLDLYWGGKHLNYNLAELNSTFVNILTEAAEFDTEEIKILFETMKVENVIQLKQKGHITNSSDCDIAMELDKSSWRNLNDESLDIDRELADEDFTKEICGSLLERNLLSSIQAPGTTSLHEDSVSKEDICPSSPLAKPDTSSLYSENGSGKAEQTKHGKSQDDLRQKVTVPANNNSDRQSVSKKENKEDDVSPQLSVSLRNLNRHSYEKSAAADTQNDTVFNIAEMSEKQTSEQCFGIGSASTAVQINSYSQDSVDSGHNSRDLDYEMSVTEERILSLSERICEQVDTSEKDCPVSPADTMLSIKLTALSSENKDMADSENVHQDLISSPQKGLTSPSNEYSYESYPDSLKSPDEPLMSMKITVLSVDEFKALSKELWADSDDREHNVAPSSPIWIDSEDDDSEVDLEHTCKTIGNLSQMMKQEKITTFEEEIPSFPSIEQVLKHCEIRTGRTEKQNDNMENSATKGLTSLLKDSRKEDTLEHESQNACKKAQALATHPAAKSPEQEILIPYSSPSGIKASSPISPSAPIRTTNSDVMKESSPLQTERSSASHGHENSSPTSILLSPVSSPFKTCRMEPLEDWEHSKLIDVLCPLGHSPLRVTEKCNESQDTGTSDNMKTPDKKRHRDYDASLTITSGENVLDQADTPESPNRKRKRVTFKLYGSQKVDSKDANEMNQYRSNCDRNLPPLLDISYSPDNTSAKDKIRKSWGDSFVPTTGKYRRLSSSEDKNREKNVPERPVNHCELSGKDKDEQQQSSSKKHRSGRRKRKRRFWTLGEVRMEVERKNTSIEKSLLEKQDMGLHVIKRYQQIHMKV